MGTERGWPPSISDTHVIIPGHADPACSERLALGIKSSTSLLPVAQSTTVLVESIRQENPSFVDRASATTQL